MTRLKRLLAAMFVAVALAAALALPVLAHTLPEAACNDGTAMAGTTANAAAVEHMPHTHGGPCLHFVIVG